MKFWPVSPPVQFSETIIGSFVSRSSPVQTPRRTADRWSGWQQGVSSHRRFSGSRSGTPAGGNVRQAAAPFERSRALRVPTHVVRSFQPSVVGDVLSKRLLPVDVFSVDEVVVVLVHHTLGSLPERSHRRVLPPRPQVPFFIVLTTFLTGGGQLSKTSNDVWR